MFLLENQTENTDGSQDTYEGTGGNLLVQAEGVFGGANVSLEGSLDGMAFQTLKDYSGTAVSIGSPDTVVLTYAMAGFRVRAALTGATGTTDVTVAIAT